MWLLCYYFYYFYIFFLLQIKSRRSAGLNQLSFYLLQTQLTNLMFQAQIPTTGLLFGPDLVR